MNPFVRPMRLEDVNAIIALDREILGHTLGEDTLRNELNENPFAHYFVMEDETTKQVIGHIGLWIDVPNAQILNFYIYPKLQNNGLGSSLMQFTLGYLDANSIENVTLEVRPSNLKAIHLYRKYGFEQVATRRNYYDNGEDAYLMLKRIDVVKK